jgi:hypothetical protein
LDRRSDVSYTCSNKRELRTVPGCFASGCRDWEEDGQRNAHGQETIMSSDRRLLQIFSVEEIDRLCGLAWMTCAGCLWSLVRMFLDRSSGRPAAISSSMALVDPGSEVVAVRNRVALSPGDGQPDLPSAAWLPCLLETGDPRMRRAASVHAREPGTPSIRCG